MLLLISPAKTLDFSSSKLKEHSTPRLLDQSEILVGNLKKKSKNSLKKLMNVSDNIAMLNVERYQTYNTPFTLKNAKQSILAFKGDVYTGMDTDSFDQGDYAFAQNHIRILSGLYGLLKPLDLMQPYRLEMGTKLRNKRGKNLYDFWKGRITDLINSDAKDSGSKTVINLASQEYFKSVKTQKLESALINVSFKELRNDNYKVVSFSAKRARGMMCHFATKHKITEPTDLKGFDYANYVFNEKLSKEGEWVFTRDIF